MALTAMEETQLRAFLADPGRKYSDFPSLAAVVADTGLVAYDASETLEIDRIKRVPASALASYVVPTAGLALAAGGDAQVAFHARTIVDTGLAVGAAVSWFLFTCTVAELRGTFPLQRASLWRGLQPVVSGADDDRTRTQLLQLVPAFGVAFAEVRIGRTSANNIALSYSGGRSPAPSGEVAVYVA